MKTRVHAVLQVAIQYDTFLDVSEETIAQRVTGSLEAEGYAVNEVEVTRWLSEQVVAEAPASRGRKKA